jgi:hypothetical protein
MGTTRSNRRADVLRARNGLARLIGLIGALVALILVIGILLVVLGANRSNDLVHALRDAAHFLAGPFNGLFDLKKRKTEIAVDWGIAAVVWFVIARAIARVIRA